jgi:hypothetical protein
MDAIAPLIESLAENLGGVIAIVATLVSVWATLRLRRKRQLERRMRAGDVIVRLRWD